MRDLNRIKLKVKQHYYTKIIRFIPCYFIFIVPVGIKAKIIAHPISEPSFPEYN